MKAKRLVERLALLISASLLLRHGPHEVADAFIATRLDGGWAGRFGEET
jgi:putative acyl-CoA dehydrogenase